jgi:hypothetical protein
LLWAYEQGLKEHDFGQEMSQIVDQFCLKIFLNFVCQTAIENRFYGVGCRHIDI